MVDSFLSLRTEPALLAGLEQAGTRKPTHSELLEQRVSFVVGAIGKKDSATRDRIKEMILEQEGGGGSE